MNTESNNSTDGDAVTYMPADRRDWLGRQAGSNPTRSIDAQIVVDPEARTVCADYDVCLHGTPADIWHGRRLVIAVNPKGGVPDAAATMTWLEREHATTIAAICDGYSCEWNGSNYVGRLSDDASEAFAALEQALSDAPTLPGELAGVWDAGDWLDLVALPISATTTDAELEALAQELEGDALTEDVELAGCLEYLEGERERLIDALDDDE